jgi:hypothetical protein
LNELKTITGTVTKVSTDSSSARWTLRPTGSTAKATSFNVDADWFRKDAGLFDVLGREVTAQIASNDKLFGLTMDGKVLMDATTSIEKDRAFSKGLGTFGYPLTGVMGVLIVLSTRIRRQAKARAKGTATLA